jgi:hypothetical protein
LLHVNDESIFWFLFLLLLFWKEAGYAFVENKIEQLKINIRIPARDGRDFFVVRSVTLRTTKSSVNATHSFQRSL